MLLKNSFIYCNISVIYHYKTHRRKPVFIHLQNNVRDKVEVLLNEDTSYKNNVLKVPKTRIRS